MNFKYLLIIVILIAIIGGGVLVWQRYQQPREETKTPGTTTQTGSEVTNWKTFQNKEYKFEIDYLKSWYNYKEVSNAALFSTMPEKVSVEEFNKNYYGEGGYGLVVIDYIKPEYVKKVQEEQNTNDPIEAYFKESKSMQQKAESRNMNIWKDFAVEKTEIGGMSGVRTYVIWMQQNPLSGTGIKETINIRYYVLDKNSNGILEIKGEFYGKNRERYFADFNQMLSTFKFL